MDCLFNRLMPPSFDWVELHRDLGNSSDLVPQKPTTSERQIGIF